MNWVKMVKITENKRGIVVKKCEDLKQKHVLVLGLGVTGLPVATVLRRLGNEVTINDRHEPADEETVETCQKLDISLVTGSHPTSLLSDKAIDLVVKNPGIPYENPMVVKAQSLDIPVITDLELVSLLCEGDLIGITGSNGKTTTTEMTYLLLKAAYDKRVHLGGNIGIPLMTVIQTVKPEDYLVMELSSFQLAGTKTLAPHIAAITNIYSAHLDYHHSRATYIEAKMNITRHQTADDYIIYNANGEELPSLVTSHSKAKQIPFSSSRRLENGYWCDDHSIYFGDQKLFDSSIVTIPGIQNKENAMIAIAVARLLGVSDEVIAEKLPTFKGVKHRLQFLKNYHGVDIYNDSKATNIAATKTALHSFDKDVVLIAGGLDRGNGFDDLKEAVKPVKKAFVYGQTKEKLADFFTRLAIPVVVVPDLECATKEAFKTIHSGDTLLFSPACASWDMYHTFEERGDHFISLVTQLTADQK